MFCTYLTVYRGNKLPPFYIGSTSTFKIRRGYKGSVSSSKYKKIWKLEIRSNPHLFKTVIVSEHETRLDAMEKENFFQKQLSVIGNTLYINMSFAVPNGKFGTNVSGEKNPMYGRSRPDISARMTSKNPMHNQKIVERVRRSKLLLRESGVHKSTRNSESTIQRTRKRMSENNPSKTKCSCVVCKKQTTYSAIIRFHTHLHNKAYQ